MVWRFWLMRFEGCWELSKSIAATGVIVDAIDERAKNWYEGFGFIPFTESSNRLFLAMGTVEKLVAADPECKAERTPFTPGVPSE